MPPFTLEVPRRRPVRPTAIGVPSRAHRTEANSWRSATRLITPLNLLDRRQPPALPVVSLAAQPLRLNCNTSATGSSCHSATRERCRGIEAEAGSIGRRNYRIAPPSGVPPAVRYSVKRTAASLQFGFGVHPHSRTTKSAGGSMWFVTQ